MGEADTAWEQPPLSPSGANWQPFTLFPDDGLTMQARRGGTNQARSQSHETGLSESPEDPAQSRRSWDGRLRHRFPYATARGTRLPACEWEHWHAGSTPVWNAHHPGKERGRRLIGT